LGANAGWVSVGVDHDTAAFAVATLRRWWEQVGQRTYPAADRLLICADAGGSNGYRVRAWKLELAISPGDRASDHRLPPAARDVQVEPDRASAVQRDLDELARPSAGKPRGDRRADRGDHDPRGLAGPRGAGPRPLPAWSQGARKELATVPLRRHDFHGEWNYTVHPKQRKHHRRQGNQAGTPNDCGSLQHFCSCFTNRNRTATAHGSHRRRPGVCSLPRGSSAEGGE
jgi:hypothetical protein